MAHNLQMAKKNMRLEKEMQLKRALYWQTAVDNSTLTTSSIRKLCKSNKGIVLIFIHTF